MNPLKSLPRILYRLGIVTHTVEFWILLGWMVFYPDKASQFYFLGSALWVVLFSLKNIYFLKTIHLSYFSHSLSGFVFILLVLTFFSVNHLNSIYLSADIFLISFYIILYYPPARGRRPHFDVLFYIATIFSLFNILRHLLPFVDSGGPFFISTIHEGVLSGIGLLLALHHLLEKRLPRHYLFFIVNIGGVMVARSKAAFGGTVLFSLVLLYIYFSRRVDKRKRMLMLGAGAGVVVSALLLVFVIPNPIKSSFRYTMERDRYALNRIDIWKMSLQIFKEHPVTGVGLDNFQEVSARYNFKQTRGPANYFKSPRVTHNDYLKLLVEIGAAGLIMIILIFILLTRKILFAHPGNTGNAAGTAEDSDMAKVLILYLLLQAFFFNILFTGFFFFVFLFLLKHVLEGQVTFRSYNTKLKLFSACLLLFVVTAAYLFPWMANRYLEDSKKAGNYIEAFDRLKRAEYLNPLDKKVYYLKASLLLNFFKQSGNLESYYDAQYNVSKAISLNPYFIDAYWLEFELYSQLLRRGVKYEELEQEMRSGLEQAEKYSPRDPFIKLAKARVYREFGKDERARREALAAIALEPEYVAALYFLQRAYNYFGDEEAFGKEIERIRSKAIRLKVEPGGYLYNLYQVPNSGTGRSK